MSEAHHEAVRSARAVPIGWVLFWCLLALFDTVLDGTDAVLDHPGIASWQPWLWEASSHLLSLLLIPMVIYTSRRWAFHLDDWRRPLLWHGLCSVLFSLLHVLGMVLLRSLVYRWMHQHYSFGSAGLHFGYEYLKDVRSYFLLVTVLSLYRLWQLRRQGEARLLVAPDHGPAVESIDHPERFLVRKLGREFLIQADEIEVLAAAGNYVNLRVKGREYPLRITMQAIGERIDRRRFIRVHRSYFVNLGYLREIELLASGDARLQMADGLQLPCSRNYRDELRQRAGYTGGVGHGEGASGVPPTLGRVGG